MVLTQVVLEIDIHHEYINHCHYFEVYNHLDKTMMVVVVVEESCLV
jgi:hypothetical protein